MAVRNKRLLILDRKVSPQLLEPWGHLWACYHEDQKVKGVQVGSCLVLSPWQVILEQGAASRKECVWWGKVPWVTGEAPSLGTLVQLHTISSVSHSCLRSQEKGTPDPSTPDSTGRTNGYLSKLCSKCNSNAKIEGKSIDLQYLHKNINSIIKAKNK